LTLIGRLEKRTSAKLSVCPEADIAPISFDHLVGDLPEMQRHVETQRIGGLEIDDQLVLCRLLHRQVGSFSAFEDAINVLWRNRTRASGEAFDIDL